VKLHLSALCRAALAAALSLTCLVGAAADPLTLPVAHATVGFDARTGEPVVTIVLTASGRNLFGAFTRQHVGRRIDVRVDGASINKPVLRTPIEGGTLQILLATAQEASSLASGLSAGAAKLEIEAAAD
jgi:preprotein translocase subunit SecD